MTEIFKTVLYLSILGAAAVILLLVLKPITAKRFSARWQYFVWLFAAILMVVPFWRLVPPGEVKKISAEQKVVNVVQPMQSEPGGKTGRENNRLQKSAENKVPFEYKTLRVSGGNIRLLELFGCVWLCGAVLFLLSAFISYERFLEKNKRQSFEILECKDLEMLKNELGIKRKVGLRISQAAKTPMLAGIFRPTVYLPAFSFGDDVKRIVLRHELMHLKHRDLVYKWFSLAVNAVHWFNPFAYLLSAEISRACEIYCDEAVTKNFDENEKNKYMKAILELAEKTEAEKNV